MQPSIREWAETLSTVQIATLLPEMFEAFLAGLSPEQTACLEQEWGSFGARPEQRPPARKWDTWLLMAGRGYGKTPAGAQMGRRQNLLRRRPNIILIAPTLGLVRDVVIEEVPTQPPDDSPSGGRAVATTWSSRGGRSDCRAGG